jgi:hypothetical protein
VNIDDIIGSDESDDNADTLATIKYPTLDPGALKLKGTPQDIALTGFFLMSYSKCYHEAAISLVSPIDVHQPMTQA